MPHLLSVSRHLPPARSHSPLLVMVDGVSGVLDRIEPDEPEVPDDPVFGDGLGGGVVVPLPGVGLSGWVVPGLPVVPRPDVPPPLV